MAEHSPGPWTYDGPEHNIHVVQESQPHLRVCFLTSDGPTEANARLISAAPEMFEALKLLITQFERMTGDRSVTGWTEVRETAEKVIAKAEGV